MPASRGATAELIACEAISPQSRCGSEQFGAEVITKQHHVPLNLFCPLFSHDIHSETIPLRKSASGGYNAGVHSMRPVILLADDFEDARDIYGTYLALHGYDVVLAVNGRDTVTQATTRRPDMILLDLRMPGIGGIEALHELRANRALADVPIVAFTAHALEDERINALLHGFDAVLAKPCLPDELVAFIARTLCNTGRAAPAGASTAVHEKAELNGA
jgi:CheY-like chemotaxis protein